MRFYLVKSSISSQPVQTQEALAPSGSVTWCSYVCALPCLCRLEVVCRPRVWHCLTLSPVLSLLMLMFLHLCRGCCLWLTSSCPVDPSMITGMSPPFCTLWSTSWGWSDPSYRPRGQICPPHTQVRNIFAAFYLLSLLFFLPFIHSLLITYKERLKGNLFLSEFYTSFTPLQI